MPLLSHAGSETRMSQFLKDLPESSVPFLGLGCVALLLMAYLTLVFVGERKLAREYDPRRASLWITTTFLAFYALYAWGTGFPLTAWIPVLYVLGAVVLAFAPRQSGAIGFYDLLFILWVWLPIDTRWLQKGWPWPPDAQAIVVIPFVTSLVFLLARTVRNWEGLKFRLTFSKDDALLALKYGLPFLAIAIPFGLATDFIAFTDKPLDAGRVALSFVGVLLLVAIPEELLFRGIIMKGIEKRWRNPTLALWGSAVIFGLAHLNNGDHPDWRYGVLATIAGVFYGKAFTAGRTFSAAVMVHTLVDVIWINVFR